MNHISYDDVGKPHVTTQSPQLLISATAGTQAGGRWEGGWRRPAALNLPQTRALEPHSPSPGPCLCMASEIINNGRSVIVTSNVLFHVSP